MVDSKLNGVFAPTWNKILLSLVIFVFVLYFAPCKVTPGSNTGTALESGWNLCGRLYDFQNMFGNANADTIHLSFFGVLEFSDRAILAMSLSILIAYAVSYLASSLIMVYLKDKMK